MGWFGIAQDRIRYRGRLTPEPFAAWAKTAAGAATVNFRVQQNRLRVLARTRARQRIWRELELMARTEPLRSAIAAAADHFASAMTEASYAPALPRLTIALHRVVIVPRALIAGQTRPVVRQQLCEGELPAVLDERVREFLCEHLLVELDGAIGARQPSPVRPVLARDAWGCIGRDTEYQWMDQMFSGAGWRGHLLMYEFPGDGSFRRSRKDVDRAVCDLQASLANIPRIQRHDIIRTASDWLSRATT